ncbi:MAG: DUF3093 domain-containing protein [Candidatus Nanopelagicales bacterium]
MSAADRPAEGVDGTVVVYRERLHAPFGVWLVALMLATALGVAYGFPLGPTAGLLAFGGVMLVAAAVLLGTAPLVVVDDRVLRAGRARLPLQYVGRIAPLSPEQTREVRGPRADPAAYLCSKGWIPRSVLVEVEDETDPHPYWLISTRHGERLAPLLAAARDESRPQTSPEPPGA